MEQGPNTLQVPGYYRRRFGDVIVTAISDGYLDADISVLQRIAPDEARNILKERFRPVPPRLAVNAFLVQSRGRFALIETGSGSSMGSTLGKLLENIRASGIDPAMIDTVLLTHMHPDHSNGLCDDLGTPNYPNAELLIHEDEVAHWTDDAAMSAAPERKRVRYFEAARRQLAPYKNQLRTIQQGDVFPGVTAVPIPGHTPGHTGYRIGEGDDHVFVWGDTVHIPEVQTRRPDVTLDFDSDPDASAAMRRRILETATVDGLLIAGMHVHFPGFSHVVRDGDGYRLEPEAWCSLT